MHRNMRQLAGLALVVVSLGFWSVAIAQAPAQPERARVTITDGGRFEGRLVEVTPGKSVVLELADGTVRSWKWQDVQELQIEGPGEERGWPASSGPPPPPPVPSGAAPAPTGPGGPSGSRTETMEINRHGARYESEEDCARNDDERCRERQRATVDGRGLGVSYSKETVTKVKNRPKGAFNATIALNYYGASGEFEGGTISMKGGGGSFALRAMSGGVFPGPKGGSWTGLYFEPSLNLNVVSSQTYTEGRCFGTICTESQTMTSSARVAIIQLGAGLQWMSFGKMDPKKLTQSGFGVALGGTVGYQSTSTEGTSTSGSTYGPAFSILAPKYNAGTAKYSATSLNLFILPTKTLTMYMIGIQFVL